MSGENQVKTSDESVQLLEGCVMTRSVNTPARSRILMAEDDRATRESLVRAFELEGYDVQAVGDGALVLEAASTSSPDVIVLDVMMPNLDGLTACRRLRARGDRTPILMLTARTETSDRVSGLDAGADDYLSKPFAFAELLARLQTLLRRARNASTLLQVADLEVDVARRKVQRGGRRIELTAREFGVLEFLVRHSGEVVTRSMLADHVWGEHFDSLSNLIEVFITRIRKKIERDGAPRLLHTIRGAGYSIREPEPE